MRRPFFFAVLSLIAGALAGRLAPLPSAATLCAAGAVLAALAFVLLNPRRALSARRRFALLCALWGAAFFLKGADDQSRIAADDALAEDEVQTLIQAGRLRWRGVVASEPRVRPDDRVSFILTGVQAAAEGDWRPVRTRMRVWAQPAALSDKFGGEPPLPGDAVEAVGVLAPPPPPRTAGFFDYGAWMRGRGLAASLHLSEPESLKPAPDDERFRWRSLRAPLMRWRREALARWDRALGPDRAPIMHAMLFGETAGLDDALRADFVRAGVAHLFAVSGLHTGMLALGVYLLFRLIGVPRRPTALCVVVLLALYCALVGFRAPVFRSTLMVAFLAAPLLLRRAVDTLQALSFAATLTLLAAPRALWQTDFQLSYAAVFGIVALGPTLRETLTLPMRKRGHMGNLLASAWNRAALGVVLVLATQAALVPLLATSFQQVSLIAPLSNLVLVPLAFVLLLTGWIATLGGTAAPAFGEFAAQWASPLIEAFRAGGALFAAAPGAAIAVPPFPWWAVAAWYLTLFSGLPLRMRRDPGGPEMRRASLLLRLAGAAALLAWLPALAQWSGAAGAPAEIVMLDVGQGDALFLRTPSGRALLVDAGPSNKTGIPRFLRAEGTQNIACLFLTHADGDHTGGVEALLREVEIGRVVIPATMAHDPEWRATAAALKRKGVLVHEVARGDRVHGLGLDCQVLHPPRGDYDEGDDNRGSLVLKIQIGDVGILLTGDADAPAESEMLGLLTPEALECEVLKVAHHGSASATTSAFLGAVRPRAALVSAGRRNAYGHPAPAVLDRLEAAGAAVFTTPENGTIRLETDGHDLLVRPTRQ